MIVSHIMRGGLLPLTQTWNQIRNIRPTIKIGAQKFEITVDVHQFDKEEIRVKARPEYVIIEGKQERDTKRGFILRQFSRKFKLPKGCRPEKIVCEFSANGTLTVIAPRESRDINLPCERMVPISVSDNVPEQSLIEVKKDDKLVGKKDTKKKC